MNKDEAIRIMRDALSTVGFQFVDPRYPKACTDFARHDQEASRRHPVHPGIQFELLEKLQEIGKRRAWR